MKWGVVVLAGGLVKDPLATALGTPRKALAQIKGKTAVTVTSTAGGDGHTHSVTVNCA